MCAYINKITLALLIALNIIQTARALYKEPVGIFYENENKMGQSLEYFDQHDEIADLKIKKPALFCGKGVFLFREMQAVEDVSGIFASPSKENCIKIGSMSRISVLQNNITKDMVAVFPGYGLTISSSTSFTQIEKDTTTKVLAKSWVLMGSSPWTVTTSSGSYCVKHNFNDGFAICPVRETLYHYTEEEWLTVKKGCSNSKLTPTILSYCFSPGSGKFEDIEFYPHRVGAVIYENEDKSGKKALSRYSDFANIPKLLSQYNMAKGTLFCGTGVFLFSKSVDVAQAGNKIKFFAGTKQNNCVKLTDTKHIGLLQLFKQTDSFTIFNRIGFAFEGHGKWFKTGPMVLRVNNSTSSGIIAKSKDIMPRKDNKDELRKKDKAIGSFVLLGKTEWTVEINDNKRYCIRHNATGSYPICPVSDATKIFPEGSYLSKSSNGCKGKYITKTLYFCFDQGSGKLEDLKEYKEFVQDEFEHSVLEHDVFGILYENKDKTGKYLLFRDHYGRFHNIGNLIKEMNLKKAAVFCGRGVFYITAEKSAKIFAGSSANDCIEAGGISRILYLEQLQNYDVDTLTLMDGPEIGDAKKGLRIYGKNSQFESKTEISSINVKSFVLMGNSSWTVVTKDNKKFCLKPSLPKNTNYVVCPVAGKTKNVLREVRWTEAKHGCKEKSEEILLTYCFKRGSGKLEDIDQPTGNSCEDCINGILYENSYGKSGVSVPYLENKEDFEDIPKLVKKFNMTKAGKFCGKGVYLVTDGTETPPKIKIFAGATQNDCVKFVMITSIKLIQDPRDDHALTLFSEPKAEGNYAIHFEPPNQNYTDRTSFGLAETDKVRSFILIGNNVWEALTQNDTSCKMYCFKPPATYKDPVCSMSYSSKLLNGVQASWSRQRMRTECEPGLEVKTLPYCFERGSQLLEPVGSDFDCETCASGTLYESLDKSGKHIHFMDNQYGFKILDQFTDNEKMSSAALFCGKGLFLFRNTESDSNKLFSGTSEDDCVVPGSTDQILLLQNPKNAEDNTFTVFDGFNIGDNEIIHYLNEDEVATIPEDKPSSPLVIRSFLIMGKSNWQVTTDQGQYCFKMPEFPQKYKVCSVANSTKYIPEGEVLVKAYPDCDAEAKEIFLNYCFTSGSGRLEDVDKLVPPSACEICPIGILFEKADKSGKQVPYLEYSSDFADIKQLLKDHKMSGGSLFCGNGVFLFRNDEADLNSNKTNKLFAGNSEEQCVRPGSTTSILLLQKYTDVLTDTLVVFNDLNFDYFQNPYLILTGNENEKEEIAEKITLVQSFFLIGKSDWEITLDKASFCLKHPNPGEFLICPVANAKKMFPLFIEGKPGCRNSLHTHLLKNCFRRGSGKLEVIPGGGDEGVGGTTPKPPVREGPFFPSTDVTEDCPFSDEFTMFLRFRMKYNIENPYQIQFPLNKIHSWRTEILDNTIEIVITCLTSQLIHSNSLRLFREMYYYIAEKFVWTGGNGWPRKPKQKVFLLGYQTERCLKLITKKNLTGPIDANSKVILSHMKVTGIEDKWIRKDLRPVKGLDLAMEFIWLSINFVGGFCHNILEYRTDFWMDYMSMTYDMYLRPMVEFWKNPGHYATYYPILFGGHNLDHQYRGLAASVSSLYQVSNLEHFPRPNNVLGLQINGTDGINWAAFEVEFD